LLIIIVVAAVIFIIYKVIKTNLPPIDIEEKMIKHDEEKDIKSGKSKDNNTTGDNHGDVALPNDSVVDRLGPTMDSKIGENLWFNELVEMETMEVKNRKRRAPKALAPLGYMQETPTYNNA